MSGQPPDSKAPRCRSNVYLQVIYLQCYEFMVTSRVTLKHTARQSSSPTAPRALLSIGKAQSPCFAHRQPREAPLLCFHIVANSFFRNSPRMTLLQTARGVYPLVATLPFSRRDEARGCGKTRRKRASKEASRRPSQAAQAGLVAIRHGPRAGLLSSLGIGYAVARSPAAWLRKLLSRNASGAARGRVRTRDGASQSNRSCP